jgi:hypothetical protein
MGGSNDSDNLVELTVEEHAEAHKKLFEQHGYLQDKLAWLGLSGLISTAEIVHTLQTEGMKGSKNPMYGKPAPNRGIKRPGVGGRPKEILKTIKQRCLRFIQTLSATARLVKTAKVKLEPPKGKNGTTTAKKKVTLLMLRQDGN